MTSCPICATCKHLQSNRACAMQNCHGRIDYEPAQQIPSPEGVPTPTDEQIDEESMRFAAANFVGEALAFEAGAKWVRAALAAQPQAAREYRHANPLGGPAKVFRAMADAIEAGDSYEDTLRRFEYAEAKPAPAEGDGPGEPLYLVHAGGDCYQGEIVPESKLDDAYLLTQWFSLDDISPEERADALAHFHDDDAWTHTEVNGTGERLKFDLTLEDGWIEVIRLPAMVAPKSDGFVRITKGSDYGKPYAATQHAQAEARAVLEPVVAALSHPQPKGTPITGAYVWLTEHFDMHPRTALLVTRFARALAEKLAAAEKKYGYSDGWADPGWMDECRTRLIEHLGKGDPRDVAAYCAFLWHHGESTTAPTPAPAPAHPQLWRDGGPKTLDPNKTQLCRVGVHSSDAQAMGQNCDCPPGTCRMWNGGLKPAVEAPAVAPGEQLAADLADEVRQDIYSKEFDSLHKWLDEMGAPRMCKDNWYDVPFSLRGRVEVLLTKAALSGTRTVVLEESPGSHVPVQGSES